MDPFSLDGDDGQDGLAKYTTTIRDASAGNALFEESAKRAENAGRSFARSMTSALSGVILKGRSLGDTLRALGQRLAELALNVALKPLENVFSNTLASAFNFSGVPTGFANGGAFQQGLPIPFARGGVIAAPATFPMPGGRTGLMAERGPEAILPLGRAADGRLGVVASGAASPTVVNFNVTTPDAESFRRSETQLAALLARTVARGQRNL